MKHQLALNVRARKLEERLSAKAQGEQPSSQRIASVLLPLPEIPLVLPDSQGDASSDMLRNFRRFGLAYLDENGDQLEFSAGAVSDDGEGNPIPSEESDAATSECSDPASDAEDPQPEWPVRDVDQTDYWPYPSQTVSRICER